MSFLMILIIKEKLLWRGMLLALNFDNDNVPPKEDSNLDDIAENKV